MSVILNALRAEVKEKGERSQGSDVSEGFFVADQTGERRTARTPAEKRVFILAAALVTLSAGVITLWWLQHRPATITTPAFAPPPEATAEDVPQVSPMGGGEEARAAFTAGDYERSITLYREVLASHPNDAVLHNDLGMVFLKQELYSAAEAEFNQSLELDQGCAECLNNLGYLKTLLGDMVEAETYLKKATQLKSPYPDPFFNLGVLYEKGGDIGNAVKAYRQYLVLLPPDDVMARKVQNHLQELMGQ